MAKAPGPDDDATRYDTIPVVGPPGVRRDEPQTLGSLAPRGEGTEELDPDDVEPHAPDAPRYVLGELIGRGGMGEVRVARDTRIDRDVAVKVLRSDRPSRDLVARFLREAQIQGRLEHPSIVPVHDLGHDAEGQPFFVMKRLTGATLFQILDGGEAGARWSRRMLLSRLVDVCQAIAFAHQRGVVHRDLKPGNIMLGDFGEVYVLDWGVARILDDEHLATGIHRADLDSVQGATETAAGALLGTPGYMAPEQLRGEPIDGRADVYALGCILFELLTGQPALPHGDLAYEATLSARAHRPRGRAPEADVPPELDDLCAAATAPSPDDRLVSAEALAAGIQRYLDGDRDLIRRRELADHHAATARELLASPGTAARAGAMAEAGRALALDPTHAGAQALIGRLLLERPAEIPAEVGAAVGQARVVSAKVQLRTAARTYLAYFGLAPLLLFTTIEQPLVLVAIAALILSNAGLSLWMARRGAPIGRMFYLGLVIHAVLLATNAMLFSPFLVIPALAATSVAAFASHPTRSGPRLIVLVHALALVTPVIGELVGLLPPTFTTVGATLAITPWAVVLPATRMVWVVSLIGVTQLIAAATLVRQLRRAEEAAQQDVYLNAWHLQQLLPSG
jgi:serine/threonine-protein kinase